jgi:hypothetical protein
VVARHGEEREAKVPENLCRAPELIRAATVRHVSGDDEDIGPERRPELADGEERREILPPTDVRVGDVENSRCHGRGRLYTRGVSNESPEIFDDVYLGLRAGGAVRKQRRGEPLSAEEREAIGRWRRLSLWRKAIAIGAFALGTFGLGFTVGGLIFGRWRTAKR